MVLPQPAPEIEDSQLQSDDEENLQGNSFSQVDLARLVALGEASTGAEDELDIAEP